MIAISLGWGVQSWALAAMSALGILPRVDVAIHADTTHERAETYAFAAKWTLWLEERDIRVVIVSDAEQVAKVTTEKIEIPAHTTWENGELSGQLRRQCTGRWKIVPIRRWLQANRNGEQVEQWIGITLDEVTRMKPSDVKYVTNIYPFIDMLDRPWRRSDVISWLRANDLEVPVKSSCVFCPYRSKQSWEAAKRLGGSDWQKAVEVDELIRYKRPNYICYLSSKLKPLSEAIVIPEDVGFVQPGLFDDIDMENVSCDSGACFL